MALKIRLQRRGRAHSPVYQIVIAESSAPRDGKSTETVGLYNPLARGQDPELKMNVERIDYWISKGAKPTTTVKDLIKKARKITEKNEKGEVLSYAAAAA